VNIIKDTLKEVIYAILPIALVIVFFQFTILHLPTKDFLNFLVGVFFAFVGFVLFLVGVNASLLPIGEAFGATLIQDEKVWLLMGFGFTLGFTVVIAEPGLQILAGQVAKSSGGEIPKYLLLVMVALGMGSFFTLSLTRIIFGVSLLKILLVSYILLFTLALFSLPEFFTVAFDAGGVTTGPLVVPFILALGVGMSAIRGPKAGTEDSFGFVGLSAVGSIMAVLILGIIYR
jgi:hypothetical protein